MGTPISRAVGKLGSFAYITAPNRYRKIEDEYNLTKKLLLKITETDNLLLAGSSVSLSIHRRMPYLDPLNYIQVKLLKECRKNNNNDLFDPLLRTIHAISKGMKNTG